MSFFCDSVITRDSWLDLPPWKKIITPWLRDYVIEIIKKYADVIGVISVISVIGVIGVISVIGVIGEIDNRNG